MIVGVVGLGIIGGSCARAFKKAGAAVYASEINHVVRDFVKLQGAVDEDLTDENIGDCDCIFVVIPPKAAAAWLEENMPKMNRKTLVMDFCGVKRPVCEVGFRMAEETGVTYVGGHPMAGRQDWGFKQSSAEMFQHSMFVIVPQDPNDIRLLMRVETVLRKIGVTGFQVMTPEEHDEVIAYTSQLSHVVSSSFIKMADPDSKEGAISGGSFRDLTRTAYLDDKIWSELFLENRDNLMQKLDTLIGELEKYRDALERSDRDRLRELLSEGREAKVEAEEQIRRTRG